MVSDWQNKRQEEIFMVKTQGKDYKAMKETKKFILELEQPSKPTKKL